MEVIPNPEPLPPPVQTTCKGCSAFGDPDRYPDRDELVRRIDCQERKIPGLEVKIGELERKVDEKVTRFATPPVTNDP